MAPDLSPEQRSRLLAVARAAVHASLRGQLPAKDDPARDDPDLPRSGVFVSLHEGDELRGCIGVVRSDRPLTEAVSHCAIRAATGDSRFEPIAPEDLPRLCFEVSVLGPPRTIRDSGEIEVGRHGVIVSWGDRTGLLLPQVAARHGMDREAFLAAACEKAGLPADQWKREGTTLEIFTAEVFGET